MKSCVIFGGVSQKSQEDKLKQGVDVLIATPGRLNDLINQGLVDLRHLKIQKDIMVMRKSDLAMSYLVSCVIWMSFQLAMKTIGILNHLNQLSKMVG